MKKKHLLGLVIGIFILVGIYQFIRMSNDHKECKETVKHSRDAEGNKVTTRLHICKERYSL